MGATRIETIAAQSDAAQAALRDLNNANARETSFLTPEDWRAELEPAGKAVRYFEKRM